MLLHALRGPDDLRGRSLEELDDLADQIRELIIDSVNDHGGHLGSNLGAVELSIALHRVFRSPHDLILWDTGHQAYVHKILTGRARDFTNLREGGGLSGYPNRSESEHDWIENSHASTVLSYAHGLATAIEAADARRRIVAVIGDGAMTGGMAFEGLNNLGHAGSDVTIVLNDNGRSLRPHRLSTVREPGEDPQQPDLYAPPGQDRGDRRAHPGSASRSAVACACRKRRCARCGSHRRSSKTSAFATWARSTATTSPPWRKHFRTRQSSRGRQSCIA